MEYVLDPFLDIILQSEITQDNYKKLTNLDKSLIVVTSESSIHDSYIPLTLSVKLTISESNYISHLQNILKVVCNYYYDTPIEFVDVYEREERNFIFTPYTIFGTLVYLNPEIYNTIDIQKYVGYQLLSTSLLTRYLIEKWIREKEISEDILKQIRYFDISDTKSRGYIPVISLDSDTRYTEEIIDRIDENISKMIKEGYFAYSFGIHDLEDLEIVRELCIMYDIKIVDETDLSVLICRTDVDFKITPEEWIRNNLVLIKLGEFPIFTLSFDFSFFNDYNRLYGETFRDTILKYAAYLAYARLSVSNEIINSSIFKLQVNEDLSVNVSLPTYSLVKQFKSYIEEYLECGIQCSNSSELKYTGKWNIESCKDLKAGILKRWIVQQIDDDAYPMLFKDSSGTELLIHRSPLSITYPSKFDFSETNLKEAEQSLTEELKKFYSKCHDNIEAVLLENINQMNLDELLKLIPIEEGGKTFCFSKDTIQKIDINPLTRQPLTIKTLMTEKYLEDGLRGVFDIGPLFGLYESVPLPIKVDVNIGTIKITRQYVDEKRRDLVGNIFLVEVLFEDETSSPLFEISLPLLDLGISKELKGYVDILWRKGYFLSKWATCVITYIKSKSLAVLINSPILLHAADSLYDGNIAFQLLKNSI